MCDDCVTQLSVQGRDVYFPPGTDVLAVVEIGEAISNIRLLGLGMRGEPLLEKVSHAVPMRAGDTIQELVIAF